MHRILRRVRVLAELRERAADADVLDVVQLELRKLARATRCQQLSLLPLGEDSPRGHAVLGREAGAVAPGGRRRASQVLGSDLVLPLEVQGEARALLVFEAGPERGPWLASERAAVETYAVLLGGLLGANELGPLAPARSPS